MDVYLDKLELHGFKSFPEKTVLKFHKGITAVIGPNGCGKSNIVDAILWVLGEQRIKNLRGENNEDLIFNGSGAKKPLGMTEVGSYFMKHGEQIYLARRFFRSGESKYILNDKYCRNKDIQDTLFEMQMGERKYFIFEQGSIDRLISLKPSEKRLLIEEAAGISQYLERKKETTNKLIIAEQNLENIDILLADKQNRLKELKNQVNYVRRFRQLKAERNNFLKAMLKTKHQGFQKDFNGFKSEIEKIINQETIYIKDISNLEKEDIHLEEKMWLIDKNLKQCQQEIYEVNRKILADKNEIEKSGQKTEFNKQKIQEKKQANIDIKVETEQVGNLLKSEIQKLNEFQEQLQLEKKNLDNHKTESSSLTEKMTRLKTEESNIKTEFFSIQSEKSQAINRIHDLENKNNQLENELKSKTNFIRELKNQVNQPEIESLQLEVKALTKQIETEESALKKELEAEKEKNQEIEKIEHDLKNSESEIITLEKQQKKYSEIKYKIIGSEGTASPEADKYFQDNIETKKEYHKIIENFYYEELDAAPLTDVQKALKSQHNKFLLPQNKRFPIPDKIENEPGFIGYVKKLFKLKETEIESYIKNGILVDNLENAIKINQKFNVDVVTRNAEIINKDGLLVKHREKGILNVIEEIGNIERKKAELSESTEILIKNISSKTKGIEDLRKKIETRKNKLNSLRENEIQVHTRLSELKKNKDIYLQRVKLNESEMELLSIEKEKNQQEWKKFKEKLKELENHSKRMEKIQTDLRVSIEQLEAEINHSEKNSLQKESTINLLNEKYLSLKSKIGELENRESKNSKLIKLNHEDISKLEKDIQETSLKVREVENIIQALNQKKESLENQIKSQEKEFQEINSKIKAITQTLSQKRKSLEEVRENRNRLEINLSSIKKDLFQLEEISFKELNSELNQIEETEALTDSSLENLEKEYESANEKMIKMRDSDRLNFSAESEYEILEKDFNFLLTQKSDIENSIKDMNDAIKKIDEESQVSFLKAYNEIKINYQKNFKILFDGGEAELWLTDENNITETGLEIKAQPPGKKLQSLRLLSGGEKTLTSLAFLFALFEYKPSPFCVFDEVDAALDEANVRRFLKFVHKLKEKTQFLIITHNFKTMEEADYIYGITMNEPGISTIYSMKMTGKNQLVPEN